MAQLFEIDQVGKREDLADLISLVDAHDTPLVSTAKKGSKPGNTLMSWQGDAYAAAVSTGTVDGTDVSSYENPGVNRAILQNYVQIFRRTIRVSPLALEISNVAGLKDELSAGIAKKLIELKRDMELTCLSANDAQLDAGSSTAYLTKGLATWISTAGGSVLQVPEAFRTPTASIETTATTANITDTTVQNVLKSIWSETGSMKNFMMPCGSTLKRGLTDRLTGIRTASEGSTTSTPATQIRTFSPAKGKSVTFALDQFVGDFGTVDLVASNYMPAVTDGHVLDMSGIELRYGKLPEVKELPDAGGGPIRMIEAVAALIVHNPLAHGKFDLGS